MDNKKTSECGEESPDLSTRARISIQPLYCEWLQQLLQVMG